MNTNSNETKQTFFSLLSVPQPHLKAPFCGCKKKLRDLLKAIYKKHLMAHEYEC